jgi:hypothetical protein
MISFAVIRPMDQSGDLHCCPAASCFGLSLTKKWPKEPDSELTCRNLHTARATRAASDSMGIVLWSGVWSRVMIWLLHSL